MLTTNKTANIQGQSKVGDTAVAYLSANIQSDNSLAINVSIGNIALYSENQEDVDTDIQTFMANAILTAQGNVEA